MVTDAGALASPAPRFWRRRQAAPWITPALLLLPTAGSLLAISVYPILNGLWLSFRDTSLISPEDRFVGLDPRPLDQTPFGRRRPHPRLERGSLLRRHDDRRRISNRHARPLAWIRHLC
jgi:hypothetical protein